jgi:dihydroorotase
MPIQITSTTSLKHIGGVLEEWKALVQREGHKAYRLKEVGDHMTLSSSPVSVSLDLTGEQDVVIVINACALALHREKIVQWCYDIIESW